MTANREVHKRVDHPSVGPVTVDCDVLTDGDTELKIVIMTAAPGSEDENQTPTHHRRRPTGRHTQLIRPARRPSGGSRSLQIPDGPPRPSKLAVYPEDVLAVMATDPHRPWHPREITAALNTVKHSTLAQHLSAWARKNLLCQDRARNLPTPRTASAGRPREAARRHEHADPKSCLTNQNAS